MEKLYGYKEKDVLGLYEYLKNKKGTLSEVFKKYATETGKSTGTVRNLYYALVKLSKLDADFCEKYLDGIKLNSNKIVFFSEEEEKALIKKILMLKANGYSVRSAINHIADGEPKLALRYQNKFRGILKNKKELVDGVIKEIKAEHPDFSVKLPVKEKLDEHKVNDFYVLRIKKEINALFDRLLSKVKIENEELKTKIKILEIENLRLKSQKTQGEGIGTLKKYCIFNQNPNAVTE